MNLHSTTITHISRTRISTMKCFLEQTIDHIRRPKYADHLSSIYYGCCANQNLIMCKPSYNEYFRNALSLYWYIESVEAVEIFK